MMMTEMIHVPVYQWTACTNVSSYLFTIHSEKILGGHETFLKIHQGREVLFAVCVGLQNFLVKFLNPFCLCLFHTL